jgi:C1A family cysteine protease
MLNYQFNLQKSPVDSRDFMLEAIYPESIVLPDIWDLRLQMQPVRDQGNQGTCSAQTAAEMKEWEENVDIQFKEYMSPQFVYNLRSNPEEGGMTPKDTMEILYKIGIVPEKIYPYGTFTPISDNLKKAAGIYKIQGYAQINTLDSLKKALFANGVCYFAFPVYNPQSMEFWKPTSAGQSMLGGHAVSCCGWLKDSFIIRNHWTAQWGDNGYSYLKFADWGMQWEVWTSIDAESDPNKLNKKLSVKSRFDIFKKIFRKKLHNM